MSTVAVPYSLLYEVLTFLDARGELGRIFENVLTEPHSVEQVRAESELLFDSLLALSHPPFEVESRVRDREGNHGQVVAMHYNSGGWDVVVVFDSGEMLEIWARDLSLLD